MGMDRERVPMMYDVGNAIHSTVNNGGGGTSIVLVSLSHNRGNRRLVMLIKSNGNGNGEDSNLPVFNDASFCKQIDRQSHHMEKAEPKSGKSLTVEPSIGSMKKVGFNNKVEGAYGATLPRSSDGLDRSSHLLCKEWAVYPKEADYPMGRWGGNRPKRGKERSSKPKRVLIN
ncbi:hypothetical protein Ancab_017285 [Ancistrocladus abbreviatus]